MISSRCISRFGTALAAAGTLFLLQPHATHAQETEEKMMIDEDSENATLPNHIDPTEIRRGIAMGGESGKSRAQIYYEREIAKVEPSLKGDPAQIARYIDYFETALVNDLRIFAFDASGEAKEDGTIVLTGYAEYEEMLDSLLRYLGYMGFDKIDNQIEQLPSASLGEKKFGIVNTTFAFAYGQPTEPRERVTQDFLGDPIYLLKETDNGYFLAHTSEGYVGYVDAEQILRVSGEALEDYLSGPRAAFQQRFETDSTVIPAGARLKYLADEGGVTTVLLPGGEKVKAPSEIIEIRTAVAPEDVMEAIEVGKQMIGSEYVWGGKTVDGVDCSGLVQAAFRSQGVNLPRDAYQQAYSGTLVGTRWFMDAMRPGDLVYFLGSRGKIHHTGIYLGDGKFLEATGPQVKISSLLPGEEGYTERRAGSFCFAKRVIE